MTSYQEAFRDIWKKFDEQDKQVEEIRQIITLLTEQLAIYIRAHKSNTPPSPMAYDPAKAKVV